MSNTVRTDEMDELTSLVRDIVSYHDAAIAEKKVGPQDRLILTPAMRIDVREAPLRAPHVTRESGAEQALPLEDKVASGKIALGSMLAELEAQMISSGEEMGVDNCENLDQAARATSTFEPGKGYLEASLSPYPEKISVKKLPNSEPTQQEHRGAPISDLNEKIASDVVEQYLASQIDEVDLRAAIVRILREELAGDLGVTITRNVRNIVRREINRVLVTRGSDCYLVR